MRPISVESSTRSIFSFCGLTTPGNTLAHWIPKALEMALGLFLDLINENSILTSAFCIRTGRLCLVLT